MLPAERTHYRKGLALGLTLAETFSIVVFILLLACAVLLGRVRLQRDAAEAGRDTARVDLLMTREMMRADSMSWGNADAWYQYARELGTQLETERMRAEEAESDLARAQARAAEAERLLADGGAGEEVAERVGDLAAEVDELRDSVAESERRYEEAAAVRDSLASEAELARRVGEALGEDVSGLMDLSPEEAAEIVERAARAASLEDSLATARRTIGALDRELRSVEDLLAADTGSVIDSLRDDLAASRFREDTLRGRIGDAERERDDAVGRAQYRETQLEQLRQGRGIDPPPCWLDADGDPEYIFRVELADPGMTLFNIAPAHRVESDVEATALASVIVDGRSYPPSEFLRLTLPLQALGRSRTEAFGPAGCRFWIRPVDRTGDRKEVFQERQEQLWRRFWFRW